MTKQNIGPWDKDYEVSVPLTVRQAVAEAVPEAQPGFVKRAFQKADDWVYRDSQRLFKKRHSIGMLALGAIVCGPYFDTSFDFSWSPGNGMGLKIGGRDEYPQPTIEDLVKKGAPSQMTLDDLSKIEIKDEAMQIIIDKPVAENTVPGVVERINNSKNCTPNSISWIGMQSGGSYFYQCKNPQGQKRDMMVSYSFAP